MTREQYRAVIVAQKKQKVPKLINLLINYRSYQSCRYPTEFIKYMLMLHDGRILWDYAAPWYFLQECKMHRKQFEQPNHNHEESRWYRSIADDVAKGILPF